MTAFAYLLDSWVHAVVVTDSEDGPEPYGFTLCHRAADDMRPLMLGDQPHRAQGFAEYVETPGRWAVCRECQRKSSQPGGSAGALKMAALKALAGQRLDFDRRQDRQHLEALLGGLLEHLPASKRLDLWFPIAEAFGAMEDLGTGDLTWDVVLGEQRVDELTRDGWPDHELEELAEQEVREALAGAIAAAAGAEVEAATRTLLEVA